MLVFGRCFPLLLQLQDVLPRRVQQKCAAKFVRASRGVVGNGTIHPPITTKSARGYLYVYRRTSPLGDQTTGLEGPGRPTSRMRKQAEWHARIVRDAVQVEEILEQSKHAAPAIPYRVCLRARRTCRFIPRAQRHLRANSRTVPPVPILTFHHQRTFPRASD
jgi:hypothetical protein